MKVWAYLGLMGCLLGLGGCADSAESEEAGATPNGSAGTASIDLPEVSGQRFVGGLGIGVSNLEASAEFYTSIFGMAMRYELQVPNYVNEKMLHFPQSSMGADLVLMNFVDGREHNYKDVPVKVVFYVPSVNATVELIRARGLPILSEPAPLPEFNNAVIAFASDPDGYILELIEAPGSTTGRLGALGIGVADLEAAKDFYTRVMGMSVVGEMLQIPDLWDEWILNYPDSPGSALVLLHYTDGEAHNYQGNPVKTVHFVPAVDDTVNQIRGDGLTIFSEPSPFTVQGVNARIGLASDRDGYTIEVVTRSAQ